MSLGGVPVSGVLCDISGVLAESSASGDGVAIPGSAEAVARLRAAGVRIKFVTNESARTRASLLGKLTRLGFELELEDSAPKRSIRRFVITEKAPTRAFSWLKAATTAFTLRHY